MVPGAEFTVTTALAVQPVAAVAVIVVVPAEPLTTKPDTRPTVATDVVLLLQVTPAVVVLTVVVLPTQMPRPGVAVIGATPGVTVMVFVTWQLVASI
jgi:hypothetical protein